mgnify:CR=1 FL=1
MEFDFGRDFNEEELLYINNLGEDELRALLKRCNDFTMLADTNQINRKLLINSLYGALTQVIVLYALLFLMLSI